MRNFKGLRIWEKGFEIAQLAYKYVAGFPKEEKYGLVSQITRAAVSIPANIAEGSSRPSNKDFKRFVEIALGSCFELETEISLAMHLGFGDGEQGRQMIIKVLEEQKMLNSYARRLSEDL